MCVQILLSGCHVFEGHHGHREGYEPGLDFPFSSDEQSSPRIERGGLRPARGVRACGSPGSSFFDRRAGLLQVMFLQHGVMDSSYSFIANGASDGLAFRAFDKGYDVFMGNFRGTSSLKHVHPEISAANYWDYTLDDHGNYDIRAFVAEIRRIKQKEVSQLPLPCLPCFHPCPVASSIRRYLHPCPPPVVCLIPACAFAKLGHDSDVDMTAVAHSMGAASTMLYMVNMLRNKRPHYLSRVVLMSPAGYHR